MTRLTKPEFVINYNGGKMFHYILEKRWTVWKNSMEFYKTLVQKNSVQIVFQQVKNNGPISRRELQEITGLSWGTISRVVEHLVTQEYIVVLDEKQSKGVGPKTEKFDVSPDKHYFIGVDLDNRGLLAIVTDMKGRTIASAEHRWSVFTRENVLDKLFQILDELVERYKDNYVKGIGFAVQGVADVRKGVSNYIGKIAGWKDVPLKDLMEKRYGVRVEVVHDPDCLMKCETTSGVLKDKTVKDVLMLHYNYELALGMSIMMNGQIYLGHNGRAGEIGYTILGTKEDDSYEMLEQYIMHRDEVIEPSILCDYVARGVAMANSFFNPEAIVLHIVGCPFQDMMVEIIQKRIMDGSWDPTVELLLSSLKYDAKATGAALIVIEDEINIMA